MSGQKREFDQPFAGYDARAPVERAVNQNRARLWVAGAGMRASPTVTESEPKKWSIGTRPGRHRQSRVSERMPAAFKMRLTSSGSLITQRSDSLRVAYLATQLAGSRIEELQDEDRARIEPYHASDGTGRL